MKQKNPWLRFIVLGIAVGILGLAFADYIEKETTVHYIEVTVEDSVFDDKFYYSQLSEEDQLVYREVYQGLVDYQDLITIHTADSEKSFLIMEYIIYDFPEIFWIDGRAEATMYGDEYLELEPVYVYTLEEKTQMQAEIEAEVTNIISQIPAEYSEYEKIKYIYDYLVESVDYAESETDQIMYSALVEKETVCAGYTKANQYLLNELGIYCIYVSGDTIEFITESATDEGHAWNIVKCNDDYYNVDVTWGDPTEEEATEETGEETTVVIESERSYDYLCCSDETLSQTHIADEEFDYPDCNSEDLDYYKMNNMYYETIDETILVDAMKASIQAQEDSTTFKFASGELYEEGRALILDELMEEVLETFCEVYNTDTMRYTYEGYVIQNKLILYWVYE